MATIIGSGVLSKKQLKSALNSKKKTPEKGLRNVLSQPYSKYWPILENGEEATLLSLIIPLLKSSRIMNGGIPKSMFVGKSREECKTMKNALNKERKWKAEYQENKERWDMLQIGVRSVSRGLEDKLLAAVLVSSEVDPPLMVEHLLQLAGISKVPAIIVPGFRGACAQNLGLGCAAMGLKKCTAEDADNPFHLVYRETARLSSQFPLPESLSILGAPLMKPQPSSAVIIKPKTEPDLKSAKNHHLARPQGNKRAFAPEDEEAPRNDFISLGDIDVANLPSKNETLGSISGKKKMYQPLQVKKVRPNPNKFKKKKSSK